MTTVESSTAFPKLTTEEMEYLERIGKSRSFQKGEVVFRNGDKDISFYAIRSGEIAIVDNSMRQPRELLVHSENDFVGDVSLLTGRPAVVSAISASDCETIEVTSCQIRLMLGEVPMLSDKLLEAFQLRRAFLEESDFLGIRVVGTSDSKKTLQIREFFYKNKVPHTFQDIADEDGQAALKEFGASPDEIPIIACTDHVVKQPSLATVAECLGISRTIKDELYDILIVGAGPAGLAAAVYGASEGLRTLLVDGMGPGGQAAQSSKIENYLGFPSGLPGAELANRGFLQALKFGAEFTAPVTVRSLFCNEDGHHVAELCTGQFVRSKTVLSLPAHPISDCRSTTASSWKERGFTTQQHRSKRECVVNQPQLLSVAVTQRDKQRCFFPSTPRKSNW